MKRERLKKLSADVRQHFPPPQPPGHYRVVHIHSLKRPLTDEELDRRSAAIPREPGEIRILINVVDVRPLSRKGGAEDVGGGRKTRSAPGSAASEESALEAEVHRLERRKAELERRARERETRELGGDKRRAPERDETERRRRRLGEIRKAARDTADAARRKL
jgi:hypothetical protein